jgi:Zn-dependent protease/CBS domain-containing protein
MKWSFKLLEVAGIGIFIHWTFLILIVWIVYAHAAAGQSPRMIAEGVGFVLALFACVVFHELGHALTARRFDCPTRDITLLPIGGVARLEKIPEDPMQEFLVAVAGPAVNVVIAGVIFLVLAMLGMWQRVSDVQVIGGLFLAKLMWVNIVLVLFNMLPAFPMDGGRVLRALLATRMPRVKATHIAASIGQAMAILFAIAGIMIPGMVLLLLIAVFVYLGAQGEAQAVEMREVFRGTRVRDVMVRQFLTLQVGDPIHLAAREMAVRHQKDFPITSAHQITGLLLHNDVIKALADGREDARVEDILCTKCPIVQPDERLEKAVDLMQSSGCSALLVEKDGHVVGMLTSQHLGDWLMLRSAWKERPPEIEAANNWRQETGVPLRNGSRVN